MEQLRRLVVFRVTKVEVQAEANEGRACLRFNEAIAARSDISYSAFVRTDPKLDGIVTARGDTLCLDGLKHGERLQRRDSGRAAGGDWRDDADNLHDAGRRSRPQEIDPLLRDRLCVAARRKRPACR